ncbi:MAG TPA: glycoside hydrolase family 3 N-terminal domain-containing protein [Ignavibacteriaceae bacterium]|nr:glycoside hydrolase family 3 N-terminal domain-containing protein [Ignavibacteriaceae bacterium]
MKKLLLIVLISVSTFAQTDLRHKISQMLMIGFQGKSVTDTMLINDLNKRGVGGVILFAANIESPTQLNQLTTQLKSYSSIPLFISVDQEGGKVARLNATNGYQSTYSAFKIGTYFNNEFDTRGWAGQMATWLSSAGINIDLAPVADVDVNPTSPAIGALDRSFSKIPDSVYQHCFWFIDEFHQRNIFNTLKHFPGHGSAATDSHLGFTDITNTWADSELIPFRKLIASGYNDFIMSGHLFNSNLDPNYPASLSNKVLTELLRNSLKFKGLIITDGMFMGAISNNYTFDKAVELAINAGNDVLLYTANNLNGKSLVDSVVNIVMNKISEGKITEQRIDESYNRIILKKSLLTEIKNIAENIIPDDFEISNYPNPFNSSTQINLRISRAGFVSMKLYNIIGEEIKEIVHEYMEEGVHKFLFNGNELSSGVYLLRMNIGENFLSHKIILMK